MSGAVFLNQCMSIQGEQQSESARHANNTRPATQRKGFSLNPNNDNYPTESDERQSAKNSRKEDDPSSDVSSTPNPERKWSQPYDTLGLQPEEMISALTALQLAVRNQCSLLERIAQRRGSVDYGETMANRKKSLVKAGADYIPPSPSSSTLTKTDTSKPPGTHIAFQQVLPTLIPYVPVRSEKVIVFIRVVFLKIGEIDTLKENYAADVFIQAKWREPQLDGLVMEVGTGDDLDWSNIWNPKVYVENNLGELKESIWRSIRYTVTGDAWVYERRRVKGCFLENLELDEFPFDTQDLTITMTTERPDSEIELEEDCGEISSINVQSFVDEQEWKLHSYVDTWKRIRTQPYQNSKFKHPALSTSCRASRRPGFYIWNIFLVELFICSLAFSTYTVDVDLPQSRLQLTFILLLTTVTFKFVVSQTLPRISYLTYLDKYILTSMALLCGVCIWHAIVPCLQTSRANKLLVDYISFGILGGTYFLFHVGFFLYIYFVALRKTWKHKEKDLEHKDRIRRFAVDNDQEWLDAVSVVAET